MTVLQGTISIQTDDTLVKVHTTGSASGNGAIALQFSILREIYDPASEGELSIQLQLGADNVNLTMLATRSVLVSVIPIQR